MLYHRSIALTGHAIHTAWLQFGSLIGKHTLEGDHKLQLWHCSICPRLITVKSEKKKKEKREKKRRDLESDSDSEERREEQTSVVVVVVVVDGCKSISICRRRRRPRLIWRIVENCEITHCVNTAPAKRTPFRGTPFFLPRP